MLGDAHLAPEQVAAVVEVVGQRHQPVQLGEARDIRHRDEVAAAEPADLALDAALLVRALDAGDAEEAVEAVVRAERDKAGGFQPVPTAQHLDDRGLQVVVADAPGHATEPFERADVAVEEHLLGLAGVDTVERPARGGQPHHEEMAGDELAVADEAHLPEVDLGLLAGWVDLRHLDLGERDGPLPPRLRDVAADGRLAHLRPEFFNKALEDSSGGVALLSRRGLVLREPAVDRRLPGIERRRRVHRRLSRRRDRRCQRLAHRSSMHTEPIRECSDAEPLAVVRLADFLEQLHP